MGNKGQEMVKKKIVAAIDTSTDCCLVALGKGGKLLAESSQIAPRAHQKILLSEVDRLLKKNSLKIEDVGLVVVGQGPGSYTGLRVGFATARALAQALKVPIYAFSSFEVLAAPFLSQAEKVILAMDAKRSQIYLAVYTCEEGIKAVIPPSVYSWKEAAKAISEHLSSAFSVGDAFVAYPELPRGEKVETNKFFPQGKWLLKLGWEGYLKKGPIPFSEALPLYLRLSTAEESIIGNR